MPFPTLSFSYISCHLWAGLEPPESAFSRFKSLCKTEVQKAKDWEERREKWADQWGWSSGAKTHLLNSVCLDRDVRWLDVTYSDFSLPHVSVHTRPSCLCSEMNSRNLNPKWRRGLNQHLPLTTPVINPEFLPCPFLYVAVVITIIQRRQALSTKAWCSFPSTCLRHWRAFPPYLVWAFCFFPSANACGLKLFKCSLLRTSCLIIYLLDLLSHIFSLKDKPKEKCRLSSSQRKLGDLKEFKKTLVLINNSHPIACTPVKRLGGAHDSDNFESLDPVGQEMASHWNCEKHGETTLR